MLFIAVAVVFATVFVLLLALAGSDTDVRTRLESLWGQTGDQAAPDQVSVSGRLFGPAASGIVALMRRLMPAAMLEGTRQRLVLAGEPMTVNGYLTFQALAFVGLTILPLLMIVAGAVSLNIMMTVGLVGAFAFVGFMLPQFWLRQRVGNRRGQIIKGLPDSFDLITTCVEAGLGLDASLARVAEKVEGPFAFELRRMLREISLGKARKAALKELAARTDVKDLSTFVNAVIQAEEMGSSVGTVLRVQADQLRVRRRQRAEEQAYKAPVKMIFPLVLCIFPTLFIVILGPAIITIMNDFPSGE